MLCTLAQAELRTWTLKSGKTKTAEYVIIMSSDVILKTKRGKQIKIPVNQLSQEDLDFLELANPPKLKIQVLKNAKRIIYKPTLNLGDPPQNSHFAVGARIEKTSSQPYTRELKVEIFSIADEIEGKNFVLLDRVETNLIFSAENDYTCTLWTKMARLNNYDQDNYQRRGEKVKGQMVVITDERGVIIASNVSNSWFLDIINELREFPIGKHFDKTGTRVWPPQPDPPPNWGVWDHVFS